MSCRLQTFCSFDSRSGSLFERPWAFKISPSLLCARLDGKRSMLLLGHSVISRQFGQLKPLPVCCRNHLWRQDLQKVCWHVRSFGWLVSVNWSWQREHSNSFLIASKRLSQPAINSFESFSPGCRDWDFLRKSGSCLCRHVYWYQGPFGFEFFYLWQLVLTWGGPFDILSCNVRMEV